MDKNTSLKNLLPLLEQGKSLRGGENGQESLTPEQQSGSLIIRWDKYLFEGEWAPSKTYTLDELQQMANRAPDPGWTPDSSWTKEEYAEVMMGIGPDWFRDGDWYEENEQSRSVRATVRKINEIAKPEPGV